MRILITGGTGTIGTALRQTKTADTQIGVLSRCEHRQVPLRGECDCMIADVADADATWRAVRRYNPSAVIHAAAIKHVSTGELDPLAAIRVNVRGTLNVVDAATRMGARVLLISTDKAVYPTTAYGASKMLAERIVWAAGGVVVRYGNVFGSTGSYSRYLLEEHVARRGDGAGLELRLTQPSATRFWWSPHDAARFVWAALRDNWSYGRRLYVPRLPACTMSLLVEAMLPGATRVTTGLTSSEKSHETLLCPEDGDVVRTELDGWEAYAAGGYIDAGGEQRSLTSGFAASVGTMAMHDVLDLCRRAESELL